MSQQYEAMKHTFALTRRTFIVGAAMIMATPSLAGYTELTARQSADQLTANTDIVVLDIRTPREFNGGHIEGAINIDFYSPDFFNTLSALDPTKTYLVHCAVGGRTRSAERAFEAAGIGNVLHMTNGIEQWRAQGLPLVRP